jgi:hypothetical protein
MRQTRLRYLDTLIVGLGVLAYTLVLTGDYFVPFKSPLWLAMTIGLMALAGAYRLYAVGSFNLKSGFGWLSANWVILALIAALALGGILRYQTLKNAPAYTNAELDFAKNSIRVIAESDWKPFSYVSPPFYLYLGAVAAELNFAQQVSAGNIASPTGLTPEPVADLLRLLNLGLGIFTIIAVYGAAGLFWQSRRDAAIAALLFAACWLSYQITPALVSPNLSVALVAGSLYFIAKAYRKPDLLFLVGAGALVGAATASSYGAILLLLPLLAIALVQGETVLARFKLSGIALGGFVAGFSVLCPGWLFGWQYFLEGLAAIPNASAGATGEFLKTALQNDSGLFVLTGLSFALSFYLRGEKALISRILIAFPLTYAILLNFIGSYKIERLALITPALAIIATLPIAVAGESLQRYFNTRDERHRWAGSALSLGLTLVAILGSVFIRRIF